MKNIFATHGKLRVIIMIVVIAVIAGLVLDLMNPVYGFFGKVDTGHVGVTTTFGKVGAETLEPGFHVTNWFTHINQVSVQTQNRAGTLSAFSKDIQQTDVVVSINYSVNKKNASTLYSEVGAAYFDTLIQPRLLENTKIVFSKYTAEQLVQNRETLSNEILELMKSDLSSYGIDVTAINIENLDFTDAFTNAVEAKQVASQNALTSKTEQERLTAEARAAAEREKIAAENEAAIAQIKADAAAYSIRANAEAQAEANAKIAGSVTQDLIDYVKAENWNGQLPLYMGGSETSPILDLTGSAEK